MPDGLVAGLLCDLPASLPEVVDDGPGFDELEFGFEVLGGPGVPDGLVAGLLRDLPASLPDVVDDGPGFDEPEFDPEFGFEALGGPGVPGNVPHGDPLGVVPGSFGVFGFTVDGCVLLPGAGLPGEVAPGTVPGVVFLGVAPLVELEPGVF